MSTRVLAFAAIALGAFATSGCARNTLLDIAMRGAPHETAATGMRVHDRMVLAGDMHCHVLPPDSPSHVARGLEETLSLAKEEKLDFLVLTPHVQGGFADDEEERSWVLRTQAELRARLDALRPEMLVIPGFEYTDHRYGHVGMAFADPSVVLAEVSAEEVIETPARFFESWVAHGGLLTINHPVNRPLPKPPFSQLAYNLSWRAFHGRAVAPEITWVTEHAQAVETFNTSVTYLRDQFIVGEEDRSLREASHLVDRVARAQHRRIAAVGGSDTHGSWLRPTTYVLAKEKTIEGVREAIAGAHTCVRSPEACSLEIRAKGSPDWAIVGDSLEADARPKTDPDADVIEARAAGGDVTLLVNGEIVAHAESGATMTTKLPRGRCAVVRAIVGRSWSSGVYVGCGF